MFVALHGLWNREPKSGYKVITVNPKTGEVRDFLTGFLNGATTTARPVDLQVTPDGALLLTDNGNGLIYIWDVSSTSGNVQGLAGWAGGVASTRIRRG